MANGERETLDIPARMRDAVDERDGGICRFCGQYAGEQRALHHIEYGGSKQGMGGRRRHAEDNLMTVGWLFQHDCHSILHSNKRLWMPLALEVVKSPGLTVLQLYRWRRTHGGGSNTWRAGAVGRSGDLGGAGGNETGRSSG